jgi:hypothetical protein
MYRKSIDELIKATQASLAGNELTVFTVIVDYLQVLEDKITAIEIALNGISRDLATPLVNPLSRRSVRSNQPGLLAASEPVSITSLPYGVVNNPPAHPVFPSTADSLIKARLERYERDNRDLVADNSRLRAALGPNADSPLAHTSKRSAPESGKTDKSLVNATASLEVGSPEQPVNRKVFPPVEKGDSAEKKKKEEEKKTDQA